MRIFSPLQNAQMRSQPSWSPSVHQKKAVSALGTKVPNGWWPFVFLEFLYVKPFRSRKISVLFQGYNGSFSRILPRSFRDTAPFVFNSLIGDFSFPYDKNDRTVEDGLIIYCYTTKVIFLIQKNSQNYSLLFSASMVYCIWLWSSLERICDVWIYTPRCFGAEGKTAFSLSLRILRTL